MRALRDFNIPKIVTDDVPIFMGLIGDLFPALDVPRKRDVDFEKMVKQAAIDLQLQPEDNFILKVSLCFSYGMMNHFLFCISLCFLCDKTTEHIRFDAENFLKYTHKFWTSEITVTLLHLCLCLTNVWLLRSWDGSSCIGTMWHVQKVGFPSL